VNERLMYRIGALLLLFGAIWVLDIHVGYLRLVAGMLLICISLGMWDTAAKRP
jgi:hypothetical protein